MNALLSTPPRESSRWNRFSASGTLSIFKRNSEVDRLLGLLISLKDERGSCSRRKEGERIHQFALIPVGPTQWDSLSNLY